MVKQRKGVKEELIASMKTMEPKTTKPTPEQLRIAQILEKKVVDPTIKLKLKQIMDATQRSKEEVYVALHDSDFDANRAVNLLIEGENQMANWCKNEKRKKKLAEIKDKKEEVEVETPEREKNDKGRGNEKGRVDDKRRPGRRQDGARAPRKQQELQKKEAAPRRRPGYGSMVFERSNPPAIDAGSLPPVKNHWEKPLVCFRSAEDDWDCEEFQGSLSQTQIFTSKKVEPQEKKEMSPQPPLPSLTFTNKALENEEFGNVAPQKRDLFSDIRPSVASQDRTTESRPAQAALFKLSYTKEDRRPSKIPTSAVEMPPELMPSLSFLDIQFGAMDLSLENGEPQSNQQNSSATPPSSTPSSVSLMANIGNSSKTSLLTAAKCTPADSSLDNIASAPLTSVTTPPGFTAPTSITSTTLSDVSQSLSGIANSSNSIANPLNSSDSAPSNSISGGISHLMTQNSIQPGTTASNAPPAHMANSMNHLIPSATNRYMPSSQVFNGSHLQYGIINPPGSSYESRDNAPHLPPYKSPPGVPKGSMVPNLPPGSIVPNQYLVGQGNVPYFPHPPIYYYEEVPPVINSQQRLTNITSHHYDVSYQTAPSTRDTVHYNV